MLEKFQPIHEEKLNATKTAYQEITATNNLVTCQGDTVGKLRTPFWIQATCWFQLSKTAG